MVGGSELTEYSQVIGLLYEVHKRLSRVSSTPPPVLVSLFAPCFRPVCGSAFPLSIDVHLSAVATPSMPLRISSQPVSQENRPG